MAATRKTPKKAGLPAAAKPKDNAGAVVRLPATCAARVRMYRHGLGDCFLLSFPRKGPRDFHVLIDCGIILTGADASALIGNVVADVKAATGSTIDVLVATHEHWDHLSGFATAFEAFNTITFEEVWLAWTEKPGDGEADKLREKKAKKVKALQLGVAHLEEELKATGAPPPRTSAAWPGCCPSSASTRRSRPPTVWARPRTSRSGGASRKPCNGAPRRPRATAATVNPAR